MNMDEPTCDVWICANPGLLDNSNDRSSHVAGLVCQIPFVSTAEERYSQDA
jgi:hypothetical protein